MSQLSKEEIRRLEQSKLIAYIESLNLDIVISDEDKVDLFIKDIDNTDIVNPALSKLLAMNNKYIVNIDTYEQLLKEKLEVEQCEINIHKNSLINNQMKLENIENGDIIIDKLVCKMLNKNGLYVLSKKKYLELQNKSIELAKLRASLNKLLVDARKRNVISLVKNIKLEDNKEN